MIIYVCFIIFDGIVLCSSQPIKISMTTKPEGPDLEITTNLNSTEHYVTSNLTVSNSKSRRFKRSLVPNHNPDRRSFSKNVSGRVIKRYSSDVVKENSNPKICNKSILSHARRTLRSITNHSSNTKTKSKRSKRSSFKGSLPERSIKVDSRNITKSKRSKRSSFQVHATKDSGNIIDAKSNRYKRSLFHVHGRRSLSEHSSGRSTTNVEQRLANDENHGDKTRKKRLKDGYETLLRRGKRGSMFAQPYDGNILLTVQLFLLFIPLASAVALSVVPWTSDDDSTSTWGPAGDYACVVKDENADVAEEFVLNRINGADPLAKRLKLERILGHQCPCLYDPSAEANKSAKTNRWGYYMALLAVAVLIAFLVYKIVVIVS